MKRKEAAYIHKPDRFQPATMMLTEVRSLVHKDLEYDYVEDDIVLKDLLEVVDVAQALQAVRSPDLFQI
eukprot:6336300-Prorocentrum_lima.AAC.1